MQVMWFRLVLSALGRLRHEDYMLMSSETLGYKSDSKSK